MTVSAQFSPTSTF